jgi:hypothetical protein
MANSDRDRHSTSTRKRRAHADDNADVVNLGDMTEQRALDIRGQIDQLDTEISELYSQKTALTKRLAGVWSAV